MITARIGLTPDERRHAVLQLSYLSYKPLDRKCHLATNGILVQKNHFSFSFYVVFRQSF